MKMKMKINDADDAQVMDEHPSEEVDVQTASPRPKKGHAADSEPTSCDSQEAKITMTSLALKDPWVNFQSLLSDAKAEDAGRGETSGHANFPTAKPPAGHAKWKG